MMMSNADDSVEKVARAYVDAMGRQAWGEVAALLDDALVFRGPRHSIGKERYLEVLKRLGLIWKGNELRRVFVDRDEAAVLYDFVSSTEAGDFRCVEWLRIMDGRIREIDFLFEREGWPEAELRRRAEAVAA